MQCNVQYNVCNNPLCIAMLPQVVVQVLSQLQETSHHDALLDGDGDHLNDGGDGDADHIDDVDDGGLDDPDGDMYQYANIADFRKQSSRCTLKWFWRRDGDGNLLDEPGADVDGNPDGDIEDDDTAVLIL